MVYVSRIFMRTSFSFAIIITSTNWVGRDFEIYEIFYNLPMTGRIS